LRSLFEWNLLSSKGFCPNLESIKTGANINRIITTRSAITFKSNKPRRAIKIPEK
jgi:hypothetical protein